MHFNRVACRTNKFRVKRLWCRLDSCDIKDFKSKVKGIFDMFFRFIGRKNALYFSELIEWCQTGKFNAFWSCDEFGKRLGHQADFKIFLSGTLDPSVSVVLAWTIACALCRLRFVNDSLLSQSLVKTLVRVEIHCVFLILFPKLKMSEWKYNKWISVYE